MNDDSKTWAEGIRPRMPVTGDPGTVIKAGGPVQPLSRRGTPVPSAYLGEALTLQGQPTAWQSIPTPIRFVVWLWSVLFLIGAAGFALGAVVWIITLLAVFGSQ